MIGILLFVGFYIYATTIYPGGSQVYPDSKGFDWINNYWCTMFDKIAINGQLNPARPFSIIGMIILWLSLLIFFFMFSETLSTSIIWKRLIKISATISLILASLLFTNLHDLVTTTSSIIGLLTLHELMVELLQTHNQLSLPHDYGYSGSSRLDRLR